MDWTFEAIDIVSGRKQTIDPGWPRSEPATDPLNGFPGNYCADERLYKTPDGVYVLVWRADQYRPYYECQRMLEREARAWCEQQRIAWPEEFTDTTPMTAAPPPAAPRTPSFIVVFDETTRHEIRLDVSAECWGPVENHRDWDGFEGYWLWSDLETMYRQGKRFVLYIESDFNGATVPTQKSCRTLLHNEAASWFERNPTFPCPPDLAHLQTMRSADDVSDDDIEAARQREAANAQLTPDELELLFLTGHASEPANVEAEPATEEPSSKAAVEAATNEAAAVKSAPSLHPDIEAAIAEAAARNEALPPDERKKLDALFGASGRPRKVNKAEAEKRAQKYLYVDNLPWPGQNELARRINYYESRIAELPAVQRYRAEHPEVLPAYSPKAVGMSDANEDSISVGEPHSVLNAVAAKEEAEQELQRLADERRAELAKAEDRLAELARATAEQLGEMRADNAPPKFMGKAIGRRRKV